MCITKRINYAFYYYINASDKKTKTIWDNGFCPGTIGTKIRDNAGTKRKKVKVEPWSLPNMGPVTHSLM